MKHRPAMLDLAITLALNPLLMLAADDSFRIEGTVRSAEGGPVTNALVMIASARRPVAHVVACPACAAECGKSARTGADGHFQIGPVNQELQYSLVVVAKGCQPAYLQRADPFNKVEAELVPRQSVEAPADRCIRGKLIDPRGNPVIGATLKVEGATTTSGIMGGGGFGVVTESLTVTDDDGRFLFVCTNGVKSILVGIAACGLSNRGLWLDAGRAYFLRLRYGVTIVGRILAQEAVLVGLPLALNRQVRVSTGPVHFLTATEDEGRFKIEHVPAETRYYLYTRMEDMRGLGLALPLTTVVTGADASTLDLGDLTAQSAYRITGRLALSDGKPFPRATALWVSLTDGLDRQTVPVDADGSFGISGIPPSSLELDVSVNGYRLSDQNPSRHPYIPGRLIGRVASDVDDFVIHLEPSSNSRRQDAMTSRGSENEPLRGAKL
jgi:hypothetical protein